VIYTGDCLEVLAGMPENSIDTCITDPPYELGFMGKKWDSSGIAFQPETWQAVYRVLKPGALLLAFGGTRTYHRMVCAIEDAGFEIRDTIGWVYGCLSEDTEILTINGWEQYHKAIADNPVLCYNLESGTFEFNKPTRSFCYENKHTAYRIQSDYTDQLVSRNHRCIVERGGRKVFAYAETLQRQEDVPFLESLRELPETIYDNESHTSIKKSVLLSMCETPTKERKATGRKKIDFSKMRHLWERVLQTNVLCKKVKKALLFIPLQRHSEGRGVEKTRPQGQAKLDGRVGTETNRKNDGREQPRLEGRSNLLQDTWELCRGKVCALSERIFGNVAQRWLCYGASFDNGSIAWQTSFENRSRSSYQSRSGRQSAGKSNVIQEQPRPQTPRSTRAKVTPIEYKGNVWCVEVPTGAFVARRNGKIFITGNSGFPKSYDISKGIDKQAGAEREVVGNRGYSSPDIRGNSSNGRGISGENNIGRDRLTVPLTAPSTPEAQLWDGWGTALKPAMELIVVAMKPLDGTYVENALKWGVAGMWIDGGRIEGEYKWRASDSKIEGQIFKNGSFGDKPHELGRYPSDFIHDGSDEVLELFPDTGKSTGGRIGNKGSALNMMGTNYEAGDPGYGDSGSAARFFYCAKASRAERNAGLEGMALRDASKMSGGEETRQDRLETGLTNHPQMQNHHPTVKPIALMRYLARITKTPTGGTVLDPFMGSGTTGIACVLEGREFIGIEREPEYVEIAEKRIAHYRLPIMDEAGA